MYDRVTDVERHIRLPLDPENRLVLLKYHLYGYNIIMFYRRTKSAFPTRVVRIRLTRRHGYTHRRSLRRSKFETTVLLGSGTLLNVGRLKVNLAAK